MVEQEKSKGELPICISRSAKNWGVWFFRIGVAVGAFFLVGNMWVCRCAQSWQFCPCATACWEEVVFPAERLAGGFVQWGPS